MNARSLPKWRRRLAPLCSVSLAIALCSCGDEGKLPSPLRVDLTALRTCEALLQRPPLPAIRPTDNAAVAFAKDDAQLLDVGDRLDAGRGCVAYVRESYGAKGN